LGLNFKEETLWIFHWVWGIPPGEKTRVVPKERALGCQMTQIVPKGS
jgi:hypothetical protein